MGLLDSVKGVLTNTIVDKAASALGIESGMAKSAIKLFLLAIIGGLINKGSSSSGAGGLLDLLKGGGYGDNNLGDLAGVLGNESQRSGWLKTGGDLLGNIFGNNQSSVLDGLLGKSGLGKAAGSSLLSFLAPIIINKLASVVTGRGLDAAGLTSYFNEQKGDIAGFSAPSGSSSSSTASSGGGMMKWLLPLLLAAAALWYFTKDGCNQAQENTKTEVVAPEEVPAEPKSRGVAKVAENGEDDKIGSQRTGEDETPTREGNDYSKYTISEDGNIITGSGAVAHSMGSYDIDKESNILSADGRVLIPGASFAPTLRTKLLSMYDIIRKARMKTMFGNMIVRKTGAKSSYGLSDIEFNMENHRISNFSKAEVEGLADALKSNAKGKIEVHVYSDDGKDEKENMKLTENRANVVRDMLVTLGVKKDQISAVGKGGEDKAKSQLDKVDIVVR